MNKELSNTDLILVGLFVETDLNGSNGWSIATSRLSAQEA